MAVRMAIRILQNFHRRFRHIFGPPWDHAAHLRYFQLLLTSNGTHLIAPESKLVIIALAHEQRGNSLPVLPCLPVVLDLLFNRVLEIARIAEIAPKDEVMLQVIIYVVNPLELFRIFFGLFQSSASRWQSFAPRTPSYAQATEHPSQKHIQHTRMGAK